MVQSWRLSLDLTCLNESNIIYLNICYFVVLLSIRIFFSINSVTITVSYSSSIIVLNWQLCLGMSIDHGECLHIVNICTSEKYKLLLDCFVSGRSSKELLLRSKFFIQGIWLAIVTHSIKKYIKSNNNYVDFLDILNDWINSNCNGLC